jgi:RecA/RadA recombinase
MARKKKEEPKKQLITIERGGRGAALVQALKTNNETRDVYCASDLMANWRYIDFVNPTRRLPCISLEWLFGSRGLLAGRILKLQASYGKGKSSFMWLQYACAQMMSDAFCYHIESEAAPPPPDFIASFGCNPMDLAVEQPKSLEQAFAYIDEVIATIRGGYGGQKGKDGKFKKTKFTSPLDPNNEVPIAIGVDSFSALALNDQVQEDVADMAVSTALAKHSRETGDYLRRRSERLKSAQALLMLAAHEKASINTGFGAKGPARKTSLADSPIGFHSTYVADVTSTKYVPKSGPNEGRDIGDKVRFFITKNKLSPKHRQLEMYLVRDQGFDLVHTDVEFLLKHSASPLIGRATKNGQWITCKDLSKKAFGSDLDFLTAFYNNTDYVMSCREQLRIRGCGFDFETKYMPTTEEVEDNLASPEGDRDLHGVENSTAEVQDGESAQQPEG